MKNKQAINFRFASGSGMVAVDGTLKGASAWRSLFFFVYIFSVIFYFLGSDLFFFACLCEIGQFPTTVEFCFRLAASSDTA